MIFDGVVRSSREHLGHLGPLVAVGSVGEEENPLLMRHPLHLEDGGVEVVVPPLSALLAQTALYEFSYETPSLRSVLLDQSPHEVILLLSPGLLSQKSGTVILGLPLRNRVQHLLFRDLLLRWLLTHNLKITAIIKIRYPSYNSPSHIYSYVSPSLLPSHPLPALRSVQLPPLLPHTNQPTQVTQRDLRPFLPRTHPGGPGQRHLPSGDLGVLVKTVDADIPSANLCSIGGILELSVSIL